MRGLLSSLGVASAVLIASVSAQHVAEVRPHLGKPTLFVNGEAVTPAFYALTHAYGARWSWEEVPQRNLKNFGDIGFRLFQLDLYFEDVWPKGSKTLNMDKALRQVRGLLDVCPDAKLVMRVHVNAPYWWNEANREECVTFADGPIDQRTYGPPFNLEDGDVARPLRASLASLKWREEAGAKLKEFCEQLARTDEGNAIIGMHISCGVYGEWHNWGFPDHDPDTSAPMTRYFREWLTRKYGSDAALQQAWGSDAFTVATATVPDLAEREFSGDGIFRDAARERRVIDYFTAQHEVVAEDIEYFTAIPKRHWPRSLIVGVFYGYLHTTFSRQAAGGHLAIERVVKCPSIDYLSAPQSYWGSAQRLGGSGNSRGVIESALLHGKLWLDELDNGHLQKENTGGSDAARTAGRFDPEYFPVLRRSAVYPLMRGAGVWYYDFGPRQSFGWWDDPKYLQDIKAMKQLFDSRLDEPYRSAADVLYVWDQESFYHVKSRWTPVSNDLVDQAFEEALQSGTSSDQVYLFDLPRIDLSRYRAVLFMNVFKLTAEQRAFINEKVARQGRTLIWNYLPGYTDGERNSLDHVRNITGFEVVPYTSKEKPAVAVEGGLGEYDFEGPVSPMVTIADKDVEVLARLKESGRPVVARRAGKDHVSVYSTLPLHRSELFRAIFRKAGCHIYSEANEFTYANSGLLMVHSKAGGHRTLHLRNGKRVEIDLPALSTWLLNAETGEPLMK